MRRTTSISFDIGQGKIEQHDVVFVVSQKFERLLAAVGLVDDRAGGFQHQSDAARRQSGRLQPVGRALHLLLNSAAMVRTTTIACFKAIDIVNDMRVFF